MAFTKRPAALEPQGKPDPFQGGKNADKPAIAGKVWYNSNTAQGPSKGAALKGLKRAAQK